VNKLMISGAGVAALAVAGGTLWAVLREPPPPPAPPIPQSAYIPPDSVAAVTAPVRFSKVGAASGIDFKHENGAFLLEGGGESRFMPETMGPGVALFDYDGDKDLDVFVPNSMSFDPKRKQQPAPTAKLYRNEGNWRFTDVTRAAGLELRGYGMGAAAADYDGDADQDLLVTAWGGLKLMQNRGDGTFTDVTQQLGLKDAGWRDEKGRSGPPWATSAAFFDADEDGTLDLFVAHYVEWSPQIDVFSTIDGERKSYAKPDLYHGSSCRLFVQRKGRFVDATEESGIYKDSGKALAVSLWDFNQDGRLDIAVANDTQPNFLFEAQGKGKFIERALEAGIAYDENGGTRAGMGLDVADTENNTGAAIVVGNFSREPVSVFKMLAPGVFREASQQTGVAAPTYLSLTFGLTFADFDLDGWMDLAIANGHIEPRIQDVEAEVSYRQPVQLLGNDGTGHFVDWGVSAGEALNEPIVGRGLAVGDLDGDGDVDFIIGENNGPLHLYRNDTPLEGRHYLRVTLAGRKPNTNAIGARLELHADGKVQRRLVRTGSSYLSQSELTQTFGLGANGKAERLVVTWPSGATQVVDAPAADAHIVISEHDNSVAMLGRK
jgi:enediyne biosynthesis protein E4